MPPVPWGASKLLWPVKQRISIFISSTSIGITPAVCEASTINISPLSLQSLPIFPISTIFPVKLEACVQIIAFVLFLIKLSNSSYLGFPNSSALTKSISKPFFSHSYKGLSTELCSKIVLMACIPSLIRNPFTAIFRLSVELYVNAILLQSLILNNLAIFFLVSKTILPASKEAAFTPLPAFPKLVIAATTASITSSGFFFDVAALSK